MDLGLEFLVGVLLFEGEMLCCCDRGEKGWIITLRVGRFVTFVGVFWKKFVDAELEVQVWFRTEGRVLRGGKGGLEYFFKDLVSVVE
jgi:hypothetical protein